MGSDPSAAGGVDPATVHTKSELVDALRQLRGSRSYTELDRALHPGSGPPVLPPSTLSNLLKGKVFPGRETLVRYLTACGLDEDGRVPWLQARERVATGHLRRPAGAVRVREARPRHLGVHASIQIDPAAADLPAYVPRDLDAGLRAAIEDAAERGGFVLLVGESSVGKTRTLHEVLRAALPDWWLIHPDPADPGELRALAAEPAPRTVVWLDEIQRYLDGERGLTAGTVRALLRASSPIVVVGTLWPNLYYSYSSSSTSERDQQQWEREVMELADVVPVPAKLSSGEQKRAADRAHSDARLSAALAVTDYGMTQVLAAAPQFVRRWENAPDPYSRAVLTVAVDAARLGARGPLPSAFLRAAAEGYCNSRERARAGEDWYEQALTYATETLHGAAAALAPTAAQFGDLDGYLVADYLLQHSRRASAKVTPPDVFWQSAYEHITDSADLGRLADSAGYRRLLPHGEHLYRAAADAGVAWAHFKLAELLDEQNRPAEAESVWRVAAALPGNGAALQRLQICLERQGRVDEAEQLLRDAAAAGASAAYTTLWYFMSKHGRTDEAVEEAKKVVAAGAAERESLAKLLDSQGHEQEAEAMMRQAVAAGEPALMELGYLLEHHGDLVSAAAVYRQGVEAEEYHGYESLCSVLIKLGQVDEAEHVARQAVADHAHNALASLAAALDAQGRTPEAERLWLDALAAGEEEAISDYAGWLEDAGRLDEAEQRWREAFAAGERLAFPGLIRFLRRQQRPDEIERLRNGSGIEASTHS